MSDSKATRDQHSSSIRESGLGHGSDPNPEPDPATSTSPDATSESNDNRGVLERTVPPLATPIRKMGFWGAIVSPILYVPLLVTGLSTPIETLAFFGLVAINVLALYVGHAHRR